MRIGRSLDVLAHRYIELQKSVGGVGLREAHDVPFTRKDGERGRGSSLLSYASAKAPRSDGKRRDAEGWVVAEDVT